jgi:hypothetical protein
MITKDATSWTIILELSIVLLESSVMLFENIYGAGVTHDDQHTTIIIFL